MKSSSLTDFELSDPSLATEKKTMRTFNTSIDFAKDLLHAIKQMTRVCLMEAFPQVAHVWYLPIDETLDALILRL